MHVGSYNRIKKILAKKYKNKITKAKNPINESNHTDQVIKNHKIIVALHYDFGGFKPSLPLVVSEQRDDRLFISELER
jgi:hypothetical protein